MKQVNKCSECDEPDCPGLIYCPACGIVDHGIDAETHVLDHGMCWACHKAWQFLGLDEENDHDDRV